ILVKGVRCTRFHVLGYMRFSAVGCERLLPTRNVEERTQMTMNLLNLRTAALVALAAMLSAPAGLHSQVTTGTILGKVSDTTGAVMAGATVGATSTATGAPRTATTNGLGEYIFLSLPVGT